jgi:excisionase family DNA binding protein
MTAHQSDEPELDLEQVSAAISKKTIVRRRPTRPRGGPRFYTAAEAGELLGTSTVTIYRAVRDGELPGVRIRGRVIVPAKALEALADATVDADDQPSDAMRLRERA